MLNFVGYMVFSSFEYCGLIMLILSIFNCNVIEYKKEFFITVFSVTFVSYFVTILNPSFTILIVTPLLITSLRFLFKEKLGKSIIMILGGLAAYLAIQFGELQLAIFLKYLNVSDLNNAFEVKSYVMQTLSSTVAITISIYLRVFHGGFGFSLKSKKKPYHIFLYVTIISFLLSEICFVAFSTSNKIALFNITGVMLVVSSLVVTYLSYKRDNIEYS